MARGEEAGGMAGDLEDRGEEAVEIERLGGGVGGDENRTDEGSENGVVLIRGLFLLN
jgi:hypothetical protein